MVVSIIKLAVKGFGKALKIKKKKRISNKPFTPDKPLKDSLGRRFVWEQGPVKGLTGKKIYKE